MLRNLRIPTVQIKSEVIVVNRKSASYKLFLANNKAEDVCERPSEMLNGSRTFLPVVDEAGGIVFLTVEAIMMLSMPASWEFRHIDDPSASEEEEQSLTAELDLDLSDATHVFGKIQYLARDGHTRIQDYLNRPDRFITLQQGDTVVFVNKRHVARIAPIKGK